MIEINIKNYNSDLIETNEQALPDNTPFCERRFKNVYFIAQFAKNYFLAMANYIAQFSCYLFSKYWTHHFAEKAHYHDCMMSNNLITYLIYGNQVVDFSLNRTPRSIEVGQNGKEVLIEIFGQKAIDALKIADEHVNVEGSSIQITPEGHCEGASLDFIFQYLSLVETGKSPKESIHAIAHRFAGGTPDHALFIQSISGAMFHTQSEAGIRRVKEWTAKVAKLEIIGKEKRVLAARSSETSTPLSELSPGAYRVAMLSEKGGKGHTTALIKTYDAYFLFDDNYGTLSLNPTEAVQALWTHSKIVRQEGKCEFTFTAHKLLSSS